MAKPTLADPRFHDEAAAYAHIEGILWAAGRSCPHCGVVDRSGALKNKSARVGLYKCYACRKTFTVKVGTIFEDSHIPLHVWLQAMHLIVSSKKGISANQLHRTLGITLKSAWFLGHRIREAMQDDGSPMGGPGKVVEADETFHGPADYQFVNGKGWRRVYGGKYVKPHKIVSLVERGGRARSVKVEDLKPATIAKVLDQVDRASRLHTDQAGFYRKPGKEFAEHASVNHASGEYARGDVTSNTVEGYFSILKRGLYGTYHHVDEKHLHRYLREFDFRYSNRVALGVDDQTRAERALKGVSGKRLTYRGSTRRSA